MIEITTKGRTVKISGLPIIKVPKNKVALIRGFHIVNSNSINKVVKRGEITFVDGNYPYDILLDIENCKFYTE